MKRVFMTRGSAFSTGSCHETLVHDARELISPVSRHETLSSEITKKHGTRSHASQRHIYFNTNDGSSSASKIRGHGSFTWTLSKEEMVL